MATDVDLNAMTTALINVSLINNTVNLTNSSGDLVYNTTQTLVTEAWTSDFLPAEKQWGWLATTVLILATVLVNGALLGVTWKATRLHSSLYTLLGSLAFAHTLNAFLVMPMAINAAINGKLTISTLHPINKCFSTDWDWAWTFSSEYLDNFRTYHCAHRKLDWGL